MGKTQILNAK